MKLLRQCLLIFGICLLGEILNRVIRISIPGNVIGMLILFACLSTGIIKLEMIDDISKFLLDHLPFFFVPAGVGLIANQDILKSNLIGFLTISIVSTIIVMIVTGHAVQIFKRGLKK